MKLLRIGICDDEKNWQKQTKNMMRVDTIFMDEF